MITRRNGQTERITKCHVIEHEHFVDLNLFQAGQEACKPLHQFGPAVCGHYLFHYVISGKGRLDTNGQLYHIGPGQGFLLCPGQTGTCCADEYDPWTYAWIEFDGLRAGESIAQAGLGETQPIYTPKRKGSGALLEQHLTYIIDHPEDSPMRLIGHALILLDDLIQTSRNKAATGRSKKLREFYINDALSFVEAHYQENISVQDIATACGLNRSYFGRLFRDAMNLSPQQYLIQYRMDKAVQLLKETRISIAAVGAAVGYENQLHFSRAFKAVFEMSPSEYRRRNCIH